MSGDPHVLQDLVNIDIVRLAEYLTLVDAWNPGKYFSITLLMSLGFGWPASGQSRILLGNLLLPLGITDSHLEQIKSAGTLFIDLHFRTQSLYDRRQ